MEPYRYCVSLRIFHPKIDPAEMSQVLGLDAAATGKMGDPRVTPKGRALNGVWNENFWKYQPHGDCNMSSETQHLESYLDDLTSMLTPHKTFFARVVETGGHVEYFIGLFSESSIGSVLCASLLGEIADLRIDLSFDIYAYPERNTE